MKKRKGLRLLFGKTRFSRWLVSGTIFTTIGLATTSALAHGFAGDRFFPPTIQTDDPFASDELLLPSVSYFKDPASSGSPATGVTDIGWDFSKEIIPHLAIGVSGDYLFQKPDGQPTVKGFDDWGLSAKYQLWLNAPHEAIVSAGVDAEIGGSGDQRVGASPTSTLTPTVFFGKGFGDLPDSLNGLKPLAVTGTVGVDFPLSADPNNLQWGLALEYSLPYLQAQVKDTGLPALFKNLIPLVEFSFTSPLNRSGGGTTGTINPGILYENKRFQLGAEAIIPANDATGDHVGAIIQLQIFLDDIWPKVFGRPVFGK